MTNDERMGIITTPITEEMLRKQFEDNNWDAIILHFGNNKNVDITAYTNGTAVPNEESVKYYEVYCNHKLKQNTWYWANHYNSLSEVAEACRKIQDTSTEKSKSVTFRAFWQVFKDVTIDLPSDIPEDDEDAIMDYIQSSWDGMELPNDAEYLAGSDEVDFEGYGYIISERKD